MSSNPESLTPDAALLAEASDYIKGRNVEHTPMVIIANLATRLRAALDREREMRKVADTHRIGAITAQRFRQEDAHSHINETIEWAKERKVLKARAEQAERERDTFAAELQRLKEGK